MAGRRGKQPDAEEDDSTVFFLMAVLLCVVVPWSLSVLWGLLFPGQRHIEMLFPSKTEDGHKVRHCQTQAMVSKREAHIKRIKSKPSTRGFKIRAVILLLLWCWLIYIIVQVQQVLATSKLYQNFDPYQILDLARGAKASQIKKAFHKLSLLYHPDKNPEKAAAEKFMHIKKAYDALTDPVAKRNFEMYGNPDGPTQMSIGVALPTFSKERQGAVLVLFVLLFIIGLPLSLYCCMMGGDDDEEEAGREALLREINEKAGIREAQDLVLKGFSFSKTKPQEAEALEALRRDLQAVCKPKAEASKAELLFLAHTQRKTDCVDGALSEELQELLQRWRTGALAMAQIAAIPRRERGQNGQVQTVGPFKDALLAALQLHQAIVQGLEPAAVISDKATPLLQIPHFTTERVKTWRKGPRKASRLQDFLDLSTADRHKSLEGLDLQTQEVADIDEFVASMPRVSIVEAKVFVSDETSICEGDIATFQVRLSRKNLREGEAAGSAHTPLFPNAAVSEAWWLIFQLPGKKEPITCARLDERARELEGEIKFRVRSVGKHRCSYQIICEAYADLDISSDVVFQATKPEQNEDDDDDDEDGDESEED